MSQPLQSLPQSSSCSTSSSNPEAWCLKLLRVESLWQNHQLQQSPSPLERRDVGLIILAASPANPLDLSFYHIVLSPSPFWQWRPLRSSLPSLSLFLSPPLPSKRTMAVASSVSDTTAMMAGKATSKTAITASKTTTGSKTPTLDGSTVICAFSVSASILLFIYLF